MEKENKDIPEPQDYQLIDTDLITEIPTDYSEEFKFFVLKILNFLDLPVLQEKMVSHNL